MIDMTYIWRVRRFCQTALSSDEAARRIKVRRLALFRGVLVRSGAQFTVGLSIVRPFGSIVRRNSVFFFLILKQQSTTLVSGSGSSVMKSTRSLLTLANSRISLNKSVQYCLTDLPSILDKSPPKIHCRPGIFSVKGLHFVNTSLDSKSCSVKSGRPSPTGSIKPELTVISR